MKYNVYIVFAMVITSMSAALFAPALHAQPVATAPISGKVTDEFGKPLAGVVISSENGKNQIVSGPDGSYKITLNDGSASLNFSFPGYKTEKVAPESVEAIVEMSPDGHFSDDRINLGYTSQSRNSITGAVSTIKGSQLEKFPVSTLSGKMTGMFPGMISGVSNSSLTAESVWQVIRGLSTINGRWPVVIIDGVICPNSEFEHMVPQEIESISILKDASATALYGIQGSNGMIVIQTKRGFSGDLKVDVSVDQSFQMMTREPEYIGSGRYVQLRNEAGVNDGFGPYSQFSQAQVEKFVSGENPIYYPDNDWRRMFLKDFANMQRAGVSVSGGNDGVKYFSNINFLRQSSPFKINETEKYNPAPSNMWINFRTNVDVRINKYLDGYISISGNLKREKTTRFSNDEIYQNLFFQPPTMFGPLTPLTPDPLDPYTITGNEVVTTQKLANPVYGMLNRSGYSVAQAANILTQASLSLDMSFLTKGLSMTGTMAYQTNTWAITTTHQEFERYLRTDDLNEVLFEKKGGELNTALAYGKATNFFYNINLLANMKYSRTFGKHLVDATAYVFYLQEEKATWAADKIAGTLPYKRQSLGLSALYGYDDRYFVKLDVGYTGSDQFSRQNRFIATPAISAAWVISNERFMKPAADWLSYLKLRASYGSSANDQLGTDQRFLYLDDFRGSNQYDGLRGNPDLGPERLKIQNYGIDLGLFNSLTITFDYYRNRMDNMLIDGSSSYPGYMGIAGSNFPKLNTGVMENNGFEIGLTYFKRLNADWSLFAGGAFSRNRNRILDIGETELTEDYAYRYRTTGYGLGQQWGYIVDKSNGNGYFNSEEELAAGPTYLIGRPRVGDFIYTDLNDDGLIDERDKAPIGHTDMPEFYYSFSAGFNYRNFEFSFMFQGAARASQMASGAGFYDYDYDGIYNDIHMNAWTAERYEAGEKITAPALSLTKSTSHEANDYYLQDRSYLRLRNVEVAYSLPIKWSNAISAQKIRFALSAQNLFTIDNMMTKYVDPQAGSLTSFQPYRVFNIGVSLIF